MTLESLTIDKITNGLFIVDDVSKLEEYERKILEPRGIKAMMIIPLLEGKNIIGFIGCDDCSGIRTWQPEEIQLMQIIARVIMRVILHKRAGNKRPRIPNHHTNDIGHDEIAHLCRRL